VDHAVEIMNRHDATVLEELAGGQLELASTVGENMTPILEGSLQTGRISQPGGGARMFVW
jgi:hypothetical protein